MKKNKISIREKMLNRLYTPIINRFISCAYYLACNNGFKGSLVEYSNMFLNALKNEDFTIFDVDLIESEVVN